jgi:hypothetical protein
MPDEQLVLTTDGTERRRFVVRDIDDVRHLRRYLLTHWHRPAVQFRVAGLPLVESQRAQDRFVRLADDCHCLIGEALGATTLLGGAFLAWMSTQGWRAMPLVMGATAYAVLVGKAIEHGWTRLRMLRALGRLRRRLTGEEVDEVATIPGPARPFRVEPQVVAADAGMVRLPSAPRRRKVLLASRADAARLALRVLVPYRLPRIVVHADSLPALEVQRMQSRIVRFSSGCTYLLAGLMAVAILLVGMLYEIWTRSMEWVFSEREDWFLLQLDWSDVQPVVLATLCAGLAGALAEAVWMRLRLLRVLRTFTKQLDSASRVRRGASDDAR